MPSTEVMQPWELRRELGLPPLASDPARGAGGAVSSRARSKYGVAPVEERTYEGEVFDSKGEMERWCVLLWEQRAGVISDLERQVSYPLVVNGVRISRFTADFRYRRGGELVVEDFKSRPTRTRAYVMRKKLLRALHGIEMLETFKGERTTLPAGAR